MTVAKKKAAGKKIQPTVGGVSPLHIFMFVDGILMGEVYNPLMEDRIRLFAQKKFCLEFAIQAGGTFMKCAFHASAIPRSTKVRKS